MIFNFLQIMRNTVSMYSEKREKLLRRFVVTLYLILENVLVPGYLLKQV